MDNKKERIEQIKLKAEEKKKRQEIETRERNYAIIKLQKEKEEYESQRREREKIDLMIKNIIDTMALERYAKAEKMCEEVLEIDPNNKYAQKFKEEAKKGVIRKYKVQTQKDYNEHKERLEEEWMVAKIPLSFTETPLSDAIADIMDRANINIVINPQLDGSTPITLRVSDVALYDALKLIMKQLDEATFIVKENMVEITKKGEQCQRAKNLAKSIK